MPNSGKIDLSKNNILAALALGESARLLQNRAEETWYQVQRHGYGMKAALVSQPVLSLEDAEKRLLERQAADYDGGYSYKLVLCSAPEFQRRRFPGRKAGYREDIVVHHPANIHAVKGETDMAGKNTAVFGSL